MTPAPRRRLIFLSTFTKDLMLSTNGIWMKPSCWESDLHFQMLGTFLRRTHRYAWTVWISARKNQTPNTEDLWEFNQVSDLTFDIFHTPREQFDIDSNWSLLLWNLSFTGRLFVELTRRRPCPTFAPNALRVPLHCHPRLRWHTGCHCV